MTPLRPFDAPTLAYPSPPASLPGMREDAMLRAFTKSGASPKTTFPLVLASVSVAVMSMSMDAVPRYSHDAFFAGIALTVALAIVVGKVVDAVKSSPWRTAIALVLPTAFGAGIGMVVQLLVLKDVGTSYAAAVKDLGGLVDTTQPIPWVASGVVLGGVPALLVAAFLLLASRAIRRLIGHDASEGFGVAFTGGAGLLAALGLVLVDSIATPPLFFVAIASALALFVALLVDGSRIRFLRRVYAGHGDGYDIVPADRFLNNASLAPMVARAGSASVLVRVDRVGSYRAAAAEPIALVGETEKQTLQPLLRRRLTAAAMLVAMVTLSGISILAHV